MAAIMTDILPCPWCNEINTCFEHNGEARCWLYCRTCLCDGPIAEMPKNDTKAKINATEAWNKRAASLPWKPIETAPKDRFILLRTSEGQCSIGRWWTDEGDKGKWMTEQELSYGTFDAPTHWLDVMP